MCNRSIMRSGLYVICNFLCCTSSKQGNALCSKSSDYGISCEQQMQTHINILTYTRLHKHVHIDTHVQCNIPHINNRKSHIFSFKCFYKQEGNLMSFHSCSKHIYYISRCNITCTLHQHIPVKTELYVHTVIPYHKRWQW